MSVNAKHLKFVRTTCSMNKSQLFTRRQFLRTSASVVAGISVVRGSVLGLNGATSPSERLNIAGVGVGGQGGADINQMEGQNIVALCDVDWAYAAGIFKKFPN